MNKKHYIAVAGLGIAVGVGYWLYIRNENKKIDLENQRTMEEYEAIQKEYAGDVQKHIEESYSDREQVVVESIFDKSEVTKAHLSDNNMDTDTPHTPYSDVARPSDLESEDSISDDVLAFNIEEEQSAAGIHIYAAKDDPGAMVGHSYNEYDYDEANDELIFNDEINVYPEAFTKMDILRIMKLNNSDDYTTPYVLVRDETRLCDYIIHIK